MKENDQFLEFLLAQLDSPEEKIILKLLKKYPYKNTTRQFLKEALSQLKKEANND